MSDIWEKTMDMKEFFETVDIVDTIRENTFEGALKRFILDVKGRGTDEIYFESGFNAGVIAAIAYLKEGDHDD